MKINPAEIRNQFPILTQHVNGKPLVYFDNAATTQKPQRVIEAIARYYTELNSNVHRGVHYLSTQSTIAFEESRKTVQHFIHARSENEIIFVRGTTEAINLVANSFSHLMKSGDNIIVSQMEHHSNIVPWQLAAQRFGFEIRVAEITADGRLDTEHLKSLINERTKLVALAHISNVLGTINPVKELIEFAHNRQVAVLIDGAQSAPHLPIDVQELDCDFYAFSAHKMYGPMGIGILYGKENWLDKMPPWQGGGEMIKNVSFEGTTFNELPFKFEAGTPNVAGAIGLGEAIHFLESYGLEELYHYEHSLWNYAWQKFKTIQGIRLFGPEEQHSSVISFLIQGVHPFDSGTLLDKMGIALRTGTHCAEPLMKFYGITGTMRLSLAPYNTIEELDYFFESLIKVKTIFE